MKRALIQSVKVTPYTSEDAINREGFLSGILAVKVGSPSGSPTGMAVKLTITESDQSGTIAITLMSTSSSLSYLRELEAKRRAVNVTISDVNDADAFTLSADNCRVMKMPDLTRNKEQSTITVNIYAPSVVPR